MCLRDGTRFKCSDAACRTILSHFEDIRVLRMDEEAAILNNRVLMQECLSVLVLDQF